MKELLMIAAVGSALGALVPRVLLPPSARAAQRPASMTPDSAAPRERPEGSAETAVLDLDSLPGEEPAAPSSPPSAAAPNDAPAAQRPAERRARNDVRTRRAPLPAILSRRPGGWQLDLRGTARPRTVFSGVRMQPVEGAGGEGEGFRLLSLDRMGLCSAAGVRPGDVLVGINGMPLRNADDALEVFTRARRQSRFALRFRRGAGSYTVPVELLRNPETADASR